MEYTITDMELKTHFAEKKIKVFKQICESVSSMSYDEKVKVGTIIFTDDFRHHLVMMCTHKPCTMCAKRIVNAGIKRVFYINEYHEHGNQTAEIFKNAGVIWLKI